MRAFLVLIFIFLSSVGQAKTFNLSGYIYRLKDGRLVFAKDLKFRDRTFHIQFANKADLRKTCIQGVKRGAACPKQRFTASVKRVSGDLQYHQLKIASHGPYQQRLALQDLLKPAD